MARTLENLIFEADSVFPGGFLMEQYQQQPSLLRPVELQAQYLVAEIRDLYSPTSDDQANLLRLIANLEMTIANLNEVTQCFRELRAATSGIDTEPPPLG